MVGFLEILRTVAAGTLVLFGAGCLSSDADDGFAAFVACREAVGEEIDGPANFANYYGDTEEIDIDRDEDRFRVESTVGVGASDRAFRCEVVDDSGAFMVTEFDIDPPRDEVEVGT